MRWLNAFLLTAIAGYVDAATYTHMAGLFSAHVTGNIVVFAAALAHGVKPEDYLKLLSFPLFLASVGTAVWLYCINKRRRSLFAGTSVLMLAQGMILLVASLFAAYGTYVAHVSHDALISMVFVFAMGFQNAAHRFIPGPMSTVMTGNVMNWAASVTESLFGFSASPNASEAKAKADEAKVKPPIGRMILGFAIGCALSAFVTSAIGLASCVLPALAILVMSFQQRRGTAIN